MDDFDMAQSKIGESAQRVIDRAVEESRRRDHQALTNEHIFLAFAQVEWDTFAQVMRDLELNPHEILHALEEHLAVLPTFYARELRVVSATKLVFKLAFQKASRAGRQTIESSDLFSAIFEESQGVPVSIIRHHGVEPEVLVSRIATRMRDNELREERLRKRFELPPFLKHFATNLNLLARQGRRTPVHRRDKEIRQVFEILSHREHSESVMLVGEPGVGRTAVVEGLAHRIEFEPSTVPARLRGCQVINLQVNAMVAGTLPRGMFEDHIRNAMRELKDRPNLILFVDGANTLFRARAKSRVEHAAKALRRALARGEVKMIGATTLNEYTEYIQEGKALSRHFRVVHVEKSSMEDMDPIRPHLERNYSARLVDEAIETAPGMWPRDESHKYAPGKRNSRLDAAALEAEYDPPAADSAKDTRTPETTVFQAALALFRNPSRRLGRRMIETVSAATLAGSMAALPVLWSASTPARSAPPLGAWTISEQSPGSSRVTTWCGPLDAIGKDKQ